MRCRTTSACLLCGLVLSALYSLPCQAQMDPTVVVDGVIDATVSGIVECEPKEACENREATVRLHYVQTKPTPQLDDEIDRRVVRAGVPFSFDAREYWWSYSHRAGETPNLVFELKLLVEVEGCGRLSRRINPSEVESVRGRLTIGGQKLTVTCQKAQAQAPAQAQDDPAG